jgi:hypothetical protein
MFVFSFLGGEEKRNVHGAFSPGPEARHALLDVPHWIFLAAKCN